MGIVDTVRKFAGLAKEKIQPEQAERGVDKAADTVDQRTGGKHASKVDKGRDKGQDAARKHFKS